MVHGKDGLREVDGAVHGAEFAFANVMLKPTHPEHPEWRKGILAFPAELESAFGVRTYAWLNARLESVWRKVVARTFGEPSSQSGNFGLVFSWSPRPKPAPGSILLVPAPIDDTIAEFTTSARQKIDYWESLARAAEILRRYRQPFGDALSDWAVAVLTETFSKPGKTTRSRTTDYALRNMVLNEVVCALVRCGVRKSGDSRDIRKSACEIAGDALGMKGKAVGDAVLRAISPRGPGNLFG